MTFKKIIIGNWKMNGLIKNDLETLNSIVGGIDFSIVKSDIVICPPFTMLPSASKILSNSPIILGAQDVSPNSMGAFTGEISVEMLIELGCEMVIVGHSERRAFNNESNQLVKMKASKAIDSGLIPIICVGENENEYISAKSLEVVSNQLDNCIPSNANHKNLIIAYEPIWAIGTGKVPSIKEIVVFFKELNDKLSNIFSGRHVRTLYGGSVNSNNSFEILNINNLDGVLVGGASLSKDSFKSIIDSSI